MIVKPKAFLLRFIFSILLLAGYQQLDAQQSTVDSIIILLNKSKTVTGVDTVAFYAATNRILDISLNDRAISQLEKAGEIFIIKSDDYFNYILRLFIFTNLTVTNKDKAIVYGKYICEELEKSQTPYASYIRSEFFRRLRLPYRNSNKLKEGFQYFNQKLKEYKISNDSIGLTDCYYVLGGFYRITGLLDQAIYNLKKSLSYMDTIPENDKSNEQFARPNGRAMWINNVAVLGFYYLQNEDYSQCLKYSTIAFNEFKRLNDSDVFSFPATNIALAKLMSGKSDSVSYYLDISIKESEKIKTFDNLASALQIQALYKIKTGDLDGAETILGICWKLIEENHIPVNPSSGTVAPDYYLALVRIQQNMIKDAIVLLSKDIVRLNNQRLDKLRDYKLLAELYEQTGNNEKAKEAYKTIISLQDSLQSDQKKYSSLSFETEQQISENETSMLKLKSENKIASLSRNYLFGIAILLFLIAAGIYFRFRSKQKANVELEEKNKIISEEKKRSDELLKKSDDLLLNILPSEIADEIKQHGISKAKTYSLVTVMFTDFKDFTAVSEKVSGELLVDEINYCFSAFDNIVQKHRVEKIKTVGDAYICVGGMPALTFTHAVDIVNAAVEIRNFMLERKKEKEAKGEIPFELRIGIHTGPVVAGIVGVKKFAYDIWGDTVNLAARMEQNSDAGKINISGSTYELVKTKFNCGHRGKIEAKNKGMIDMYFVENLAFA
ncbi:MAG: adenylate/guanylate cyclase domain-containing protein [Bacteroidota bacterium]